ncbi:uncharacterized protein LOC111042635 [Myzus persicae]|uniref:uncharacterized protein LOC111042635 n=1 Tax=Myzus persicae TaxID=13164 RepID=UPI000B930EC5|nr:uncharacterized protein LOC111042635 [Myzus persicae]
MPESDILNISSQYETDSKITKIEYHSYTPYTTSFNNNDEIRISIQQTDVYPYLYESFIYLEGMISEADKVKLSNNGNSYLFEQIRLEINGIEVDSTRVLGIKSSLKDYLSGTPDNYNCYENAGWNFKNGTQSANEKVASTAKVTLNKIVWKVPHITVDDGERLKLLKLVEREKIDTSKRNDSATASAVDVQLEIESSESLSGVSAYCLLIHDRIVEYVPFTKEGDWMQCKGNLFP